MVKWLNARGIMILIKWKQVNREVPSSNPADIIYQFSIFHVISYVTKTSIYICNRGGILYLCMFLFHAYTFSLTMLQLFERSIYESKCYKITFLT